MKLSISTTKKHFLGTNRFNSTRNDDVIFYRVNIDKGKGEVTITKSLSTIFVLLYHNYVMIKE